MDLPDSDIACAASQFVLDVAPAFVANHSLRSSCSPASSPQQRVVGGTELVQDAAEENPQMGISADIVGADRQMFPPGFADRAHASWPRHDLGYALAEVIARQVEDNPVKGLPLTFRDHLHQLMYGTRPPLTWFDVVRAAGCDDQPTAHRPV
jgi:hypothetical protein